MVYIILFLFAFILPAQNIFAEEQAAVQELTSKTIFSDLDDEFYENESEDDEADQCLENIDEQKVTTTPFIPIVDIPFDYISSGIESVVRNIDEYFSDNKTVYGSSGSYLLLRQNVISTDGGRIRFTSDIFFNFRMPNTEKKLKIFFESNNNTQHINSLTQTVTPDNRQYIAGVQGVSGEKFGWKYKPTLGLLLNAGLQSFIRFKFNSEYNFNKWIFNWYETPYWDSRTGWGFDSYFEFSRKISNKNLFRSSTFVGWRADTREYNSSHVFSMFHNFDNENTLSYYSGVYGLRDATLYTTRFLLGLNYRRKIYKDYLFVGIVPEVLYQRENNFKPEHSLTVRLEIFFKK